MTTSDQEILTLTHATERDVDLLLIEELVCSRDLLEVFVEAAFGRSLREIGSTRHRVLHSSRRIHNRREIDITVEIERDGKKPFILLIENKLDASEQILQADSYADEARLLVASGRAAEVRTLLVRPEDYARANAAFDAGFDSTISYEEVADALEDRAEQIGGELGSRLAHRARLMDQAITKGRRGYTAVPLPVISDFNSAYVAFCRARFPHLKPGPAMLKTTSPGESVTMIFGPETLPRWDHLPQMRLVHQLREANANLCFYGWGDRYGDLVEPFSVALRVTGFRLIPTVNKRKGGKSGLMVFTDTPRVSNQRPFAEQEDAVQQGLEAVESLRVWLTENFNLTRDLSKRLA